MRGTTLALVALTASLTVFGAAVAQEVTTMSVIERAASNKIIDIGEPGDSEGDILTFHNDLYDAANKTKIGNDNGWCVRTLPGLIWECTWTNAFADGQIVVQGPFLDKGDSVNAVTGGTGAYANVRGEMKLHARDAQGSAYDYVFSLQR